MKLYMGCSDMPIYNFYMVIKSKNYSHLVIDWDEYSPAIEETEEMKHRWSKIYNEYCKLSDDNKVLHYYELFLDITYFKIRYEIVAKLLKQLLHGELKKERFKMYADEINKWRFNINLDNEPLLEIRKVQKSLSISENKIRLKENELRNIKMDNDDKEDISFISQIVSLETVTGRNEIDPKKTSVEKFIAIVKHAKEVQKQKLRNGRKQL